MERLRSSSCVHYQWYSVATIVRTSAFVVDDLGDVEQRSLYRVSAIVDLAAAAAPRNSKKVK